MYFFYIALTFLSYVSPCIQTSWYSRACLSWKWMAGSGWAWKYWGLTGRVPPSLGGPLSVLQIGQFCHFRPYGPEQKQALPGGVEKTDQTQPPSQLQSSIRQIKGSDMLDRNRQSKWRNGGMPRRKNYLFFIIEFKVILFQSFCVIWWLSIL